MNNLVAGIGEVLWDVLPEGKKIGGAPANFAYHVSKFGLPGCLVSAVGDDFLGEEIVEKLTSKGLSHHLARVPYPTGTVQVEVDDDGVPQYDIKENAAWDNIPYTEDLEGIASRTKAVCFGTLAQRNSVSRETINRFLAAMPRQSDSLIVFDVNLRQGFYDRNILHDSLTRCNILKINDEELDIVCNVLGIEGDDKCKTLTDIYDLKSLIFTCGTKGSFIYTRDNVFFRPTPVVEVADTVGAGDSFTAAFISSLLKGKSLQEAHALAVETSAYVCTQKGAMPVLPAALISMNHGKIANFGREEEYNGF